MKNSLLTSAVLLSGLILVGCGYADIMTNPKNKVTEGITIDTTPVRGEKKTKAKAHVRHILFGYQGAIRAPENIIYKTKDEAKAKAEEILAQLQSEGADNFAELAKEYSTGPTGPNGGDLGEFEDGVMVTEFNDAVFNSTENGLINQVVETEFGFHLIYIISKTEATTITAEQEVLE